jgi:Phage tail tube protein
MAGLRGNTAWLLAQKQTAKGAIATPVAPVATPGTAGAWKMPFSGGNIGPVRETDALSETDSSRDVGVSYVSSSGVEGSPEFYVRDASIPFWLLASLGSLATAGTTPNFTHTITPAASLPYISVWRNVSDTLWESYLDCKVGSLSISAEAGGVLTATAGIQGVLPTRLTSAPGAAVTLDSGPVYKFHDRPTAGVVTLGGGATALVRSFELSIENNLQRQQTDAVTPYDVYEGQREVSLGFDLIFESLDEYNKFHYGGAAGTQISNNIFTTSAVFTFERGTDNSIAFNLPSIAYQEFPIEPSPGGDPIVASVRAVAQRGGSPVVTATVKNQFGAY